ncbi:MAG TPA: carboxypeptidase-like regulatory domain-containing protein [Candidatus Acidoferrales bacterium]|nr:carboxypeptidase-like regulatory domain-containing protein [Candidatus Acidoferrales bacterium]
MRAQPAEKRSQGKRRIQLLCVAFLVAWACPLPCAAQVFQLDAGSSTLFEGSGGSLAVRSSDYGARIDFGLLQSHPRFGFEFTAPRWGYDWQAGDQNIPFVLPTDLFDRSYYFVGRGLGIERKTSESRYFYFAGATSDAFFVPFMNAVSPQTPAAAFFFERTLRPDLKFYSRNVVSRTQTSIQSLDWSPRHDLDVGFSAGLGNNQRYTAASLKWERDWAALRASYAWDGSRFRRITIEQPVLTEQDKENVELDLTPIRNLRFTLARQNYLSPFTDTSQPELQSVDRAAVNSFGAWGMAEGTQLYGSMFLARNSAVSSRAYALGARRSITSRVDLGLDYLSSEQPGFQPQDSAVYTVREHLTPRIDLSQFIVRSNGQTTVSYGGSFLANVFSVTADYETMYFPLAGAGQPPFRQILTLGVHLQFPNGVQLNAETDVSPYGKVEYTAYGSDYLYGSHDGGAGSFRSSGFYGNIVRGRVVDLDGKPVEGAAVLVGQQVAFTDSNGDFSVRFKHARQMTFQVAFDQFSAPGSYELVSAPPNVRPVPEADASPYKIVVRRVVAHTPPQQ